MTDSDPIADEFAEFFTSKVAGVCAFIAAAPTPIFDPSSAECDFILFRPLQSPELLLFMSKSPNKTSMLDPIPTWLVKESPELLHPFLTTAFNRCLSEGHFPTVHKRAIVTPVPKKQSCNPSDLSNYRPISNLCFISKLLERVVNTHLHSHLDSCGLLPPIQSAYRPLFSTETAVLTVLF